MMYVLLFVFLFVWFSVRTTCVVVVLRPGGFLFIVFVHFVLALFLPPFPFVALMLAFLLTTLQTHLALLPFSPQREKRYTRKKACLKRKRVKKAAAATGATDAAVDEEAASVQVSLERGGGRQ